jgi:hypothetical protein
MEAADKLDGLLDNRKEMVRKKKRAVVIGRSDPLNPDRGQRKKPRKSLRGFIL